MLAPMKETDVPSLVRFNSKQQNELLAPKTLHAGNESTTSFFKGIQLQETWGYVVGDTIAVQVMARRVTMCAVVWTSQARQ